MVLEGRLLLEPPRRKYLDHQSTPGRFSRLVRVVLGKRFDDCHPANQRAASSVCTGSLISAFDSFAENAVAIPRVLFPSPGQSGFGMLQFPGPSKSVMLPSEPDNVFGRDGCHLNHHIGGGQSSRPQIAPGLVTKWKLNHCLPNQPIRRFQAVKLVTRSSDNYGDAVQHKSC